jgi:hypothetical protein
MASSSHQNAKRQGPGHGNWALSRNPKRTRYVMARAGSIKLDHAKYVPNGPEKRADFHILPGQLP